MARINDLTVPIIQQILQPHTRREVVNPRASATLDAETIADQAELYLAGDHWQKGEGWAGPRPASSEAGASDVMEEIERAFVNENVIAEVTERHQLALIGQEPSWSFVASVPMKDQEITSKQKAIVEEAQTALTQWWDSSEALNALQDATINMLATGRGYLRLFIPASLIGDDGRFIRQPKTIDEALSFFHIHAPVRANASVYVDDRTREKIAIYTYRENNLFETDKTETVYECHGLDGNRRTIIRVLSDSGADAKTSPIDLGGHLAMFEMKRKAMITPSIITLQKLVNLAWTMMTRNVVQGGFLERVITNAMLPGQWVDDPLNPGKKIYQPNPFYVGAGTTNVLQGLPIYEPTNPANPNADRKIVDYTTPNVNYRDPVSVATFTETRDSAYAAILSQVSQRHELISGDATSSGESRKQAQASFAKSLHETKLQVEGALRWLLESSLWMAAHYAGQLQFRQQLRAQAQCRVDLGAQSSEDVQQVINLKKAELISADTAMERVGVDDVEAEKAKIAAQVSTPEPTPKEQGATA